MGQRVSGGIEFDVTKEELANAANITPSLHHESHSKRMAEGWRDSQSTRENCYTVDRKIVSAGRLGRVFGSIGASL
jgi:hypothetical protein